MLNEITLIGRLGRDPELKMTPSNVAVATTSMATTEKWKTPAGEKKEETQWHNLVFWGKNAETASKYMHKGELHFIKGTVKYNKDKDYETNKKMYTSIHVKEFKLLPNGQNTGYVPEEPGNAGAYTGSGRSSDEPETSSSLPDGGSGTNYDDEIPF